MAPTCPFRAETEFRLETGLYVGMVRHRRRQPRVHAFRYPVFMAFLDLGRLDEAAAASRLVSRCGFNALSLDEGAYLPDRPEPTLAERFLAAARAEGHSLPEGARVFLLTHPKTWGFAFNPVSYYYAFDGEGRLLLLCAEVTNTPWKERHRYWMDPREGRRGGGGWSFRVPKAFHVSPFMPMDLVYRWAFSAPGERLVVHMGLYASDCPVFDATLDLARRPWSASEIRRAVLRHPWMTAKVIAAIHWEALWLWIKRVPVFTHPGKRAPAL